MVEISIKDIFRILLKRWWIVFIGVVVFGTAAYIWSNYFVVPMYTASTTLYVGKNTDQVGIEPTDLNLGSNLIMDYSEIAKSKLVAYEVIDKLGLRMSASAMASRVKVQPKNATRVIQISVSDPDPQMAMDITNKVAEVFQEKVKQIMQIENVQIIDRAELPWYPVSPNKQLYYLGGVCLGLAIGAAIIFLIEFLDDAIKTPEDVQRYTDLPVIGIIPLFSGRRA